jgi:hypothetical protein
MTQKPNFTFDIVPRGMVRQVWTRVKPLLKLAIRLSGGRWSPDFVLAGLVLGEQTLWVVTDEAQEIIGAMTTEIVAYPKKRMVAIHFLGGSDFDNWYGDLLEKVTAWTKDCECDGIECLGRSGFWRWFEADGFKKGSTFYEKRIK